MVLEVVRKFVFLSNTVKLDDEMERGRGREEEELLSAL